MGNKNIELNGIEYDLVIIDSHIIAQSTNQDILFENGHELLKDEARNLWTKSGRGFGPADFISQYVYDNIEAWVKENIESGKIETYH